MIGQASASDQASAGRPPDRDLKVRDALDRAAEHVRRGFAGRPLVEAGVRHAIGRA